MSSDQNIQDLFHSIYDDPNLRHEQDDSSPSIIILHVLKGEVSSAEKICHD
jgi:hypothetical protein